MTVLDSFCNSLKKFKDFLASKFYYLFFYSGGLIIFTIVVVLMAMLLAMPLLTKWYL